MRQINFHDLLIFTAADPRPNAGSAPVIVVIAESTGLVDGVPTGKRRSALAYIGPLAEFHQQYVPHMARLFTHEEALYEHKTMREADFLRYLNHQITLAQPLSPFALTRREIQGYAWGEQDAETLDITDTATPMDDGVGIESLYAFTLQNTDDMHQMIHQSLTLKDKALIAGNRKTLWIGRPIQVSRDSFKYRTAS